MPQTLKEALHRHQLGFKTPQKSHPLIQLLVTLLQKLTPLPKDSHPAQPPTPPPLSSNPLSN